MFAEPTTTFVNNLFSAPGLGMDLAGVGVLGFGVVCYLARVTWIALSHARRMESEATRPGTLNPHEVAFSVPYCAG